MVGGGDERGSGIVGVEVASEVGAKGRGGDDGGVCRSWRQHQW